MEPAQRNELAHAWRQRLATGQPDVVIFRDGPLSISLRRHGIHIGAGASMDVMLAMNEVSVNLEPGDTRLDWDTGSLELDLATAEALAAFGVRQVYGSDPSFDYAVATA